MSVRAYRVNEIKTESDPTFNLWHNTSLMEYFGEHMDLGEQHGLIEFDIEVLRGALDLDLEQDLKDLIAKDIKWAEKNGDNYVDYLCF